MSFTSSNIWTRYGSLVLGLMVSAWMARLDAATFSNTAAIAIPSSGSQGAAAPFPSVIPVEGLAGVVTRVTVTVSNLTHSYPSDLDILLVSPTGEKVLLMSDAGSGSGHAMTNVTLRFADDAANSLPASATIPSGLYRPANFAGTSTDDFPAPAPPLPYGTTLAEFNGREPNGAWQLYVNDDASDDSGSLARGWMLTVETAIPPRITEHPRSLTLAVGATAILQVKTSGTPPLTYQWMVNGGITRGATTDRYTIANAQLASSGDIYRVRVGNAAGSVLSDNAVITVVEPPLFTAQPTSRTVGLSSNVTFSVNVTGTGPFLYQWRQNDIPLPDATNRVLTIPNVQLTNGGGYRVAVANAGAVVKSAEAELILAVTQRAGSDAFGGRTLLTGTNGTIRATNLSASEEPGEPSHAASLGGHSIWYRWIAPADGIARFRTTGSTFDTLLAVYTGPTMSAFKAVASDEDRGGFHTSDVQFNATNGVEYQIAIDGYGGQTGHVILDYQFETTAQRLPTIVSHPGGHSVSEGSSVALSVVATGSGLRYQWWRDGAPIPGATSSSLHLPSVRPEDVGFYSVVVSNTAGRKVESQTAEIQIGPVSQLLSHGKPKSFITCTTNENGVFYCYLCMAFDGGSALRGSNVVCGLFSIGQGHPVTKVFRARGNPSAPGTVDCSALDSSMINEFSFLATNTGPFVADTVGSAASVVLAVFEYDAQNVDYLQVNCLGGNTTTCGCDRNNSAPCGEGSVVKFNAVAGKTYAVFYALTGNAGLMNFTFKYGDEASVYLAIHRSGNFVTLSWCDPTAKYLLQGTGQLMSDPATTEWSNENPTPPGTNGRRTLTQDVTKAGAKRFYRLKGP